MQSGVAKAFDGKCRVVIGCRVEVSELMIHLFANLLVTQFLFIFVILGGDGVRALITSSQEEREGTALV
jgi:hypothetical protein